MFSVTEIHYMILDIDDEVIIQHHEFGSEAELRKEMDIKKKNFIGISWMDLHQTSKMIWVIKDNSTIQWKDSTGEEMLWWIYTYLFEDTEWKKDLI